MIYVKEVYFKRRFFLLLRLFLYPKIIEYFIELRLNIKFSNQSLDFFSSDIDYRNARFCIRINSVLNAVKGTFRHVATGTIMFHNEANVRYPTNNWFVVLGESQRA